MRISDWSSDVCSSDLLPSNGNQRDRVGAKRPPAPLPQIPAAPLSRRLLRANSGAMAAAIAPQGDLKGVEGMEQDNRESWLNRVAAGMAPLFAALDAPLPARIRVAIGFTSSGRKGKAIGECWDNRLSADGHFEIFIRPDRSEEHTSELQSLMRISYAVFCLKQKKQQK